MIIFLFAVGGAVWGGTLARKRKGTRADIAQYAAGFAIAGAILGLFATILVERLL